MDEELLEVFAKRPKFTIKGDFVDSLHSKRTVVIFLVFAVLVAVRQFDEDAHAINCWLSTSLSDDQTDYVHQLCWVNSTYYFPGLSDPDDFHHERRFAVPYYQFILFILIGQAFAFYLPNLVWNYLASDSASYMSFVLDQVDLVKHWSSLVKKEQEHVEKAAKRQERERIRRLVQRTVDESLETRRVAKVDLDTDQADAGSKAVRRKTSKASSTAKRSGSFAMPVAAAASGQRVRLVEESSAEETEETEEASVSVDLLLPRFERETLNELQEAMVPLSRLRTSSRRRRKEQIAASRARARPPASDLERSLMAPLRSQVAPEEPAAAEPPQPSDVDRRRLLRKSRVDLRRIIRRPIDAVRNLTTFYFMYKLVNLANIVVQFFLLTYIFGDEFYTFGVQFIERVFVNTEKDVFSTKQFPIITFCDFFVYQNLRQIHFNTAQCLLHINIIIEKFYIVIWFWLIVLFVITLLNILSWTVEIFLPSSTRFLVKYLRIKQRIMQTSSSSTQPANEEDEEDDEEAEMAFLEQVTAFKRAYLGHDGVLMMQMIKNISGPIWFMDILYSSWINWKKQQQSNDDEQAND